MQSVGKYLRGYSWNFCLLRTGSISESPVPATSWWHHQFLPQWQLEFFIKNSATCNAIPKFELCVIYFVDTYIYISMCSFLPACPAVVPWCCFSCHWGNFYEKLNVRICHPRTAPALSCVLHYCHAITACGGIAFESYQEKKNDGRAAAEKLGEETIAISNPYLPKMGSICCCCGCCRRNCDGKLLTWARFQFAECFSIVIPPPTPTPTSRICHQHIIVARVPSFLFALLAGGVFYCKILATVCRKLRKPNIWPLSARLPLFPVTQSVFPHRLLLLLKHFWPDNNFALLFSRLPLSVRGLCCTRPSSDNWRILALAAKMPVFPLSIRRSKSESDKPLAISGSRQQQQPTFSDCLTVVSPSTWWWWQNIASNLAIIAGISSLSSSSRHCA